MFLLFFFNENKDSLILYAPALLSGVACYSTSDIRAITVGKEIQAHC